MHLLGRRRTKKRNESSRWLVVMARRNGGVNVALTGDKDWKFTTTQGKLLFGGDAAGARCSRADCSEE